MEDFFESMMQNFKKERDKALIRFFSKRIKQSFLKKIYEEVKKQEEIYQYFDWQLDIEKSVTGSNETFDYEICRIIVGIHRAHSLFLKEEEKINNEGKSEYRKKLVEQTVINIKLREYGARYFRKEQILKGEEFLFFPIIYKIYVLSIKAVNDMFNEKEKNFNSLFYNFFMKTLSALSLIENNFMNEAYSVCRLILELYFKILIMDSNKEMLEKILSYANYELNYADNGIFDKEFEDLFDNRKIKNENITKIDYIHYGWVDYIDDYHKIVKRDNPYTNNGVIKYITYKYNDNKKFDMLKDFYKKSHRYVHGNMTENRPLYDYFEISLILSTIVPDVYKKVCRLLNKDMVVNNIDVIKEI